WARLRELRGLATKRIEELRAAGQVGSSLQADLTFLADGTDFDLLAGLGDDLRFVTITSAAKVEKASGETRVEVAALGHEKCERCWHVRADVGADPAHPGLCGRCVSNLYGEGETRDKA
ncbi:MAG: isoleucine--tRNA ligase, partial [Gallionellaceae bacterium]|nr:isoleucine--tRNA ligase [Gallionellaceae bacterium]